jgi:acetolactate synthase-1/2/3 large subunit
MNGAEAIVKTLADAGISVCFANPGTSEMHLVAALDHEPRIRSILVQFEGVASGAADGYFRIAGKPAVTLLHLGPGTLNAAANLHNARRAFSPTLTVIGDQATYHRALDAPLTSDIEALVAPLANCVESVKTVANAGAQTAKALAAASGPPGGNAFLVVPADCAWEEGGTVAKPVASSPPLRTSDENITRIVEAIRAAKKPAIIANGDAFTEAGLAALARIEAAGVAIFADTFSVQIARGAGRYAAQKLPYFPEQAAETLTGVDLLIAAGTKHPVGFFAYPGKPSELTPEGARRESLGAAETNATDALTRLADAMKAPAQGTVAQLVEQPPAASEPLGAWQIGTTLSRHMPDNAILCDDAVTSGLPIFNATQNGPPHTWLGHTGGAIGQGLPMAVGAAVAANGARKTIALCGDGASMYTIQALWTAARERLDLLVLIFANRAYRILGVEWMRAEADNPGPAAAGMLSLADPAIDFVKMAEAMGVPGVSCSDAKTFDETFARLVAQKGPALIECVL